MPDVRSIVPFDISIFATRIISPAGQQCEQRVP
jgi:hypothetical protein